MSYLNADPASRDVHLWSPVPVSVPPGYHKMLEAVKRIAPTATSWGWGDADGIVEMTKGKLLYCPAGILHNRDCSIIFMQMKSYGYWGSFGVVTPTFTVIS